MFLPDFVRGTTDEQAYACRLRDQLVASLWGSTDHLPRQVRLVLRGLTDSRWWITHQHELVQALAQRLGPHADLLINDPHAAQSPVLLTRTTDRSEPTSRRCPVTRRALCLGVASFGGQGDAGDEERGLADWDALPYAERCTRELHQALRGAGYEASISTDPAQLSASALGGQIDDLLTDAGVEVAVVHVLSHGEHRQRGGVYVVGADGRVSPDTRVEDWVVRVADDPSAPHTLFLLDLCHAGAATRLQWQPPEAGQHERAWVIAAAGAADPAYAGRLTRAAATVIRRIVSEDIDFSPTLPTVSFTTLFDLIAKELRALAAQEGGYQQEPTATPTVGTVHVPFFVNPRYRPDAARVAAEAVGSATAPFVDPVLDAEHFRDRAAACGPATGDTVAGCFAGRAPQLRRLSAWMDHADAVGTGLIVVTGSPGAGKSALLGVLVCAAHPVLRGPTKSLWRHAAARPSLNPDLIAVHARQRAMDVILASLATQLGIEFDGNGEISPDAVVEAIAQRDRRPVIVIDAVDEAIHPRQLLEQLLEPLAQTRRPDGTVACQLLLGMRPWPEFASLIDATEQAGGMIDLDAIPVAQRRHDVAQYVTNLLELQPDYADTAQSPGRRAFADALAAALVPATQPPFHHDTADQHWGEFLVAVLYTHWVTRYARPSLADPQHAAVIGANVPLTLPAVLELDLAARSDTPWMRPVLHAVAHGFGAGMPLTVIQAVASVFADVPHATPTRQEIAAALDAARFYLRTSTDTDGTTLYRLFHQGLTNTLISPTRHPSRSPSGPGPDLVFDRLLDSVPAPAGHRRWDLAEPYTLRHASQHAAHAGRIEELLIDPEFLVHADPATVIAALDDARSDAAVLSAAVYATSAGRLPHVPPEGRRQILAVNAARYGAPTLLDALTHPLGQPLMTWQPTWATGSQVSSALRAPLIGNTGWIFAVACIDVNGRPVAVTGGTDRVVRIWDLTTRLQIGNSLSGHTDFINSVACAHLGRCPVAVTAGKDGTIRIWDLARRQQIGNPLTGHTEEICSVACIQVDRHLIAVTGGADGTVRIWDLTTRQQIGNPLTGHTRSVDSVGCIQVDGRPVAVTGGWLDGTVLVWDLSTCRRIGELATGHPFDLTAVACVQAGERPIAVTGRSNGQVLMWDLGTRLQLGTPLIGHTHGIRYVACIQGEGHAIAITASYNDSTVRVWDIDERRQIGKPITGHTDQINSVACTHLINGRPIAITASMDVITASADGDGVIRMWDLDGHRQIGDPRAGHANEVRSMDCTHLNGRPVVVTAGWDDTVRVWDLTDGRPIGMLPTRDTNSVQAVTCIHLHGRSIAVTGSMDEDATIRVWDLATRRQISKLATKQHITMSWLACTQVNGHLIVTAVEDDYDHLVWVWDLTSRRQIGDPLTGHTEDTPSVACTSVNGRPTIVSAGGNEGTLRMWDLITQEQIGDPMMPDPPDCPRGVACTELAGRPVAVTGGVSVQVWDLITQRQIGDSMTGEAEGADSVVCTHFDGRPIAITHSWRDASVSVWDVIASEEVAIIRLPSPVEAIAAINDTIVAAFGWDIAAFRRIPGKMQWAPVS